jgi:hypothetical protein
MPLIPVHNLQSLRSTHVATQVCSLVDLPAPGYPAGSRPPPAASTASPAALPVVYWWRDDPQGRHRRIRERFPYEQCPWTHKGKGERWLQALERTGVENVRARLAHTMSGSAGSIAIGTETSITIGFVQEWLAWHDARKLAQEARFRRAQVWWTRWAAIAASIAAGSAAIGWAWTLLAK